MSFWNFLSWILVFIVVFCIFESDKLPVIKKWISNMLGSKKAPQKKSEPKKIQSDDSKK